MKTITRTRKSTPGFTLIEILVVIVIMGIVVAAAVPSFVGFTRSMRVTSVATAIKRQLVLAKIRAIANPQVHYGVYFDTSASPPKTFIFQDNNNDGQYTAGEPLYQQTYSLPLGTKLQVGSIANSVIVFRGDGSAKNDGWNTGTITVRDTTGSHTRTITVSKNIGKVYL